MMNAEHPDNLVRPPCGQLTPPEAAHDLSIPAVLSAEFDTSELVALLLSAAVARATPWMPFAEKADQAIAKLERALSETRVRELQSVLARIFVGAPASVTILSTLESVEPGLLDTFERAFSRGRMLHFEYRDGAGEVSQRSVEPQGMLVRAPLWYIVAWDAEKGAFRMFRMDRVRSARLLESMPFVRRPVRFVSALRRARAKRVRGSSSSS